MHVTSAAPQTSHIAVSWLHQEPHWVIDLYHLWWVPSILNTSSRTGEMGQVVECFPRKHSNPSTTTPTKKIPIYVTSQFFSAWWQEVLKRQDKKTKWWYKELSGSILRQRNEEFEQIESTMPEKDLKFKCTCIVQSFLRNLYMLSFNKSTNYNFLPLITLRSSSYCSNAKKLSHYWVRIYPSASEKNTE
jgi:hypothetical protein